MIQPNLFIIGAPKCGTTSLATYLGERDDVFVSDPKEPHHFSTDIGWHLTPERAAYLDLFKSAGKQHKIVCDASVFYLYSDAAVPAILEFNPDAKFIVMVRNPVDLVISMHGEARLDGTEDIADVEQAWHAHIQNGGALASHPPIMHYREAAKNGELLQRLFERVDKSRVKVIVFDDFQRDTAEQYRETLRFLGLPDEIRTHFPIHNVMKPVKWYRLHKLMVRARRGLKAIGIDIHGTGLMAFIIRLSGAKRTKATPEFRNMLADTFTSDVNLLACLLERDLSHWLSRENHGKRSVQQCAGLGKLEVLLWVGLTYSEAVFWHGFQLSCQSCG